MQLSLYPFISNYSETIELKVNFGSNRIEPNSIEPIRVRHYYSNFSEFFLKRLIRFDRTELQNELNMMHSGDENDELRSVDRFGSNYKFFFYFNLC